MSNGEIAIVTLLVLFFVIIICCFIFYGMNLSDIEKKQEKTEEKLDELIKLLNDSTW